MPASAELARSAQAGEHFPLPAGKWPFRGTGRESVRWGILLVLLTATSLSAWWVLALFPWGMGAFVLAARLGFKPWVGWPVAVAGLLAVQCVAATPPMVRQHDVEGHREYVDHIAREGRLPEVRQGWETWQPPLYYVVAAVWRGMLPSSSNRDSFRSVQALAAIFYTATIVLGMFAFRGLSLNNVETASALGALAFVPGHVFFAARVNNDVVLPLLGTALLLGTARACGAGTRHWMALVSGASAGLMMAKGSSLAVVGAAFALVFHSQWKQSGWETALRRLYWVALPSVVWTLFWWARNIHQTGEPLYVNAALPDELLLRVGVWERLVSVNPIGFLTGGFYYDEMIKNSYFLAVTTSLLYGEYGMGGYGFLCEWALRLGCLCALAVLVVGAVMPPGGRLRGAWIVCVVLGGSQALIALAYALKFPYACNQNMRFFAQAFTAFAGLFGLGAGRIWNSFGVAGRIGLAIPGCACAAGLADFYGRVFF